MFAGYSPSRARKFIISGPILSPNGQYGGGVYLTSSFGTAVDYGFWRTQQSGEFADQSHVIVFEANFKKPFYYRKQISELIDWVKSKRTHSHRAKLNDWLPEFCAANGYDAILLPNEEGHGRDYVIALDPKSLRPIEYLEIHRKSEAPLEE